MRAVALLALAALVVAVGGWQWRQSRAVVVAPEALWRNGVIIEVRNCDAPVTEETVLQCTALICAQRVTMQLTNAQQTTLKLTHHARDPSSGRIEVAGTLEQYLTSPTLPTGFSCETTEPRDARPVLTYAALPRAQP